MAIIQVENLSKYFSSYKKQPGLLGSLKSLVKREEFKSKAVDNISFSIDEGELVGFIGPNGAGKTTTLKCLSGLLYPSSGKVNVLGFTPFERKEEFLKQISLVMGQKNTLWWDLPPIESFLLNKEIYEIPEKRFKEVLEELSALLEVKDILQVQVRKLSLGQRMKCELISALIHSPKVLFLDEPTIGLDVVMQQKLRNFIKEYNRKYNSTIILTSHYMQDVKELCKRVIIIDHGKILFDGILQNVIKKYSNNKLLTVTLNEPVEEKKFSNLGTVKEYNTKKVSLSVPIEETKKVATKLLEDFPIGDINIEEEKIEDIIRVIFTNKSA